MSLERHWQRVTPLSAALYPLSLVFRGVTALRRAAYLRGILRSERVGVPVVVVGNVSVGGTGKTPLVLWLAHCLQRHGVRPGIVSRGYGGSASDVRQVDAASDAAVVGDEPLLLARRSGCPVWIGRDRTAAARALLAANPECNAIISDDGLQHYRLARDVEIAIVDGARGFGNGFLLPAGPLREPASRLATVDAIVVNGAPADDRARAVLSAISSAREPFAMRLEGSRFHNLHEPSRSVSAAHFADKRVIAIAGIGHPPRFFAHLTTLGLEFERHAFPDHHRYVARDIDFPDADAIVMTEKDAVKCAAFARPSHWVLPVDAAPDPQLGDLVLRKLKIGST